MDKIKQISLQQDFLGALNMLMSPVNPQERNIRCKISKT